jgi:hypothetical protein
MASTLMGCADSAGGRMEVAGEVILEKKPLKEGVITFIPLDGQGTQSGAGIANGAYAIPRKQGLKPGKYLVQITAGDGKTPASDEEAAAPGGSTNIVSVDLIPAEWNTRSNKEVEVKNGKNKFNFDIPKAVVPKSKKR